MDRLLEGFDLNALKLPKRIVMSAMTRSPGSEHGVPTDSMREHLSR